LCWLGLQWCCSMVCLGFWWCDEAAWEVLGVYKQWSFGKGGVKVMVSWMLFVNEIKHDKNKKHNRTLSLYFHFEVILRKKIEMETRMHVCENQNGTIKINRMTCMELMKYFLTQTWSSYLFNTPFFSSLWVAFLFMSPKKNVCISKERRWRTTPRVRHWESPSMHKSLLPPPLLFCNASGPTL